ncbi:RNA polymerase sigma-70 factor [Ancylomarina sp. DW003]|nr:RNA polymerase sigma-70 factor [Ancylomarina sp. DW003]MDE5423896.1 RNA polymerase sigma-70 factor [Ancylomarina sp. DW003]
MSPADSKVKIREIDFKKLFDSYFPSLCVFANKFVKDEDLSKDIVQEVFVKIWNKVDEFESEKSMKVYFYLSTKNACFDSLKKEKKRNVSYESAEIIELEDKQVVNEILREETYRMLETAIGQLPDKAQEVMRLNLNGLSNTEIADELEVSVNTIKTHKILAFRKVREIFGKEFAIFLLADFYHFLS